MDLIEQLGGYENASKHFNRIEYHAETKIFIDERFGFHSMRDLKDALLEYRREHSIFEVGDLVVKTNPKIKHAHVRIVISTSPSGGAILDYQGFPYKLPCIRHATDEEIKAGCRL